VAAKVSSKSNGSSKTPAVRLADLERRVGELSAELEAERARSAQLERAAARHERQKIAQALHNTVCQSLSGVSLEAAVLSRELQAEGSKGAADGKALRELIRKSVGELHELVQSLRRETADSGTRGLPRPVEIHSDLAGPSR